VAAVQPNLLQFHGNERAGECSAYGRPWLAAVPMGADAAIVTQRLADHAGAAGFLFDAHAPQQLGGTGETFDWARIPQGLAQPVVLAGGLNPDNVGAAIAAVRPYAVDVSSGIESAPGIKEFVKMQAFIEAVRRSERS